MQFSDLQTRFLYLIGETDTTSITDVHKSHINYAIKDILNQYPFSWSLATEDLTLSSGVANLNSTFNPKWGIEDARIVTSGQGGDHVFTRISISERDKYSSDDYVYWLTYTPSTGIYVFNTLTQSGTVTVYYHTQPALLSAAADYCIVPDTEAVAYLAASKNWIGDERNQALKQDYEQEAKNRITAMWVSDMQFGPDFGSLSSLADFNLAGSISVFEIERP